MRPIRIHLLLFLVFLCAGCHLPPLPNTVRDLGPRYKPSNFYRMAAVLPPQIRRVAVLPLSTAENTAFLKAGVDSLGPLVCPELAKCKRFEIIPITPAELSEWTGKPTWTADEPLPHDFFDKIASITGADAVMFCQLTRYSPYQPVAAGWKLALVANPPPGHVMDSRQQIIWCADEVIDAGEPGVANAAHDYYNQHIHDEAVSADASTILDSPTRFGQYTLAALLATLPERLPPGGKEAKADLQNNR